MNFKAMLVATVLVIGAAIPAKAQVVIDMSLITCKQFMDSDPDRKVLIASWMSGYFSASKNSTCSILVMSSAIGRLLEVIARSAQAKR